MFERSRVNAIYRVIKRGADSSLWYKPGWNGTEGRTGEINLKNEQQGKGSLPWKGPPPGHLVGL